MPFQLIMKQRNVNEDVINVLNFTGEDSTAFEAIPTAQYLIDNVWSRFATIFTTEWRLEEVLYRAVPAGPQEPYIPLSVNGLPLVGGITTIDPMPLAVAMRVSTRATEGPPYRGGFALGGFAQNATNRSGVFDDSIVQRVEEGLADLDAMSVNLGKAIHLAIRSAGTATVPVDTLAQVSSTIARQNPSIMKKRGVGKGS